MAIRLTAPNGATCIIHAAFGDETRYAIFRGTPPHRIRAAPYPNDVAEAALNALSA